MKRVIGLGGIFFKSENPEALREWYKTHLGIQSESWGAMFPFLDKNHPDMLGCNLWTPFSATSTYFEPSTQPFMINFRVADLVALMVALKEEGVTIVKDMEDSEYGKFASIMDPEGNKLELWEPPLESDTE